MTINVDSKDVYKIFANHLDTMVTLGAGSHKVYVKAWDNQGHYFDQIMTITVSLGTVTQSVVSNIDDKTGWTSCSQCAGPGGTGIFADNSLTQNVVSPSLDGNSAQFWLGGTHPYTNALFTNHLGGRAGASNFVLDFDFYMQNPAAAQALEFDIFYARDGHKNYFLTECDTAGQYAGTWQVSNVVIDTWQHTGLPCQVKAFAWNHVTLEFYRQPDGNTRFVSASMNGNKQYVNRTYTAPASSGFEMKSGIQLDGNSKQDHVSIWIERLKITYW